MKNKKIWIIGKKSFTIQIYSSSKLKIVKKNKNQK